MKRITLSLSYYSTDLWPASLINREWGKEGKTKRLRRGGGERCPLLVFSWFLHLTILWIPWFWNHKYVETDSCLFIKSCPDILYVLNYTGYLSTTKINPLLIQVSEVESILEIYEAILGKFRVMNLKLLLTYQWFAEQLYDPYVHIYVHGSTPKTDTNTHTPPGKGHLCLEELCVQSLNTPTPSVETQTFFQPLRNSNSIPQNRGLLS